MKRYLGVFMATVMFLNGISIYPVAADENYNEYIIPLGSDQTNRKQIIGRSNQKLLKEGVVYIPIETACEIAGATISLENDDAVIISRNYVSWCCEYDQIDNQYLLVDRNTGKGSYFASVLSELVNPSFMTPKRLHNTSFSYSCLDDDVITLPVDFSYCTDIPCDYYDNELYVSFYEFLTMMGVQISTVEPTTHYDALDSILSGLQLDLKQGEYEALLSTIMDAVYGNSNATEMFICTLGTPVDALYREYYELQKDTLMCDLSDYYTEWDVKWANLVNSAASFEGITETVLAAMNLNTDYSETLASILSKVKGDTNSTPSMPEKITNTVSLLWTLEGYREATFDLKKKMGEVAKAANDQSISVSFGYDEAFDCVLSAAEHYQNFQCLNSLYENDKTILADSILNSEYVRTQAEDEYGEDFGSTVLLLLGRGSIFNANTLNTENSYTNLIRSAEKVQILANTSSPAMVAALQAAVKNAATSTLDNIIVQTIDTYAFGGVPVTEYAVAFTDIISTDIAQTIYAQNKATIAEFDDCVFIQEVARSCYRNFDVASDNAFSSFVLGIKASLSAYDAENALNESKTLQERMGILEWLLSETTSANRDFYRVNPKHCGDLTDMLGGNTDVSKLDTSLREEITLKSDDVTMSPNQTPADSETIDYEEIYYSYIKNELIPKYGLATLNPIEINYSAPPNYNDWYGLISTNIYELDGNTNLLTVRLAAEDSIPHIILEAYSFDDAVQLADSYNCPTDDYMVGFEVGWTGQYIFVEYWRHFNYGSSSYGTHCQLLSIADNHFEHIFALSHSHAAFGYNWIHNPITEKTYFETFDGSASGLLEGTEKIKEDLATLNFSRYEIGYEIDPESFHFKIQLTTQMCEFSIYDTPLDYTNLRDHIIVDSQSVVAIIPDDAVYYNGHAYKCFDAIMTWQEAQTACEKIGGHLATITTAEEQAFLASLNGSTAKWIGGYRPLASTNDWKWVTGEPWEYTNWGDGEPNNSDNVIANETCVAMWPAYWNDLNESSTEQEGYICEWDCPDSTISSTSWKKLYAQALRKHMTSHYCNDSTKFDLVYIDEDDVPELVVCNGTAHMDSALLYYIYDGEMIECSALGDSGAFRYWERNNQIWCSSYTNGDGGFYLSVKSIQKGELVVEISLHECYPPDRNGAPLYEINGEEVTETVYNQRYDEYFSDEIEDNFVTWMYSYADTEQYYLNEETISQVFAE